MVLGPQQVPVVEKQQLLHRQSSPPVGCKERIDGTHWVEERAAMRGEE